MLMPISRISLPHLLLDLMIKSLTRWSLVCCLIGAMTTAYGQNYNIGIRAGLSQSQFIGPSEANANEDFSFTGGFHFGLNFQWNFTEVIGIRTEIIYNQTGSQYSFSSADGYNFYRPLIIGERLLDFSAPREEWPFLRDQTNIELDHNFAYIQFPQTINVKITDKWEAFAGGYISLLLNPLATGTLNFGDSEDLFENPQSFSQGLDFDFDSDIPGGFNQNLTPRLLIVDGKDVDIPGAIGAYYLFENVEQFEDKFNSIDYGLIGGFSYYFNRGFYGSVRVEYGLNDITRTEGDVSLQELNPDRSFVFNEDDDRTLGLFLSLGFKF